MSPSTPGGALVGVHCYLDEVRVLVDPGTAGRGPGTAVVEAVAALTDHRAPEAVRVAHDLVAGVLADLGVAPSDVAAVGAGLPSPVDLRAGRVSGSGVRDGWGPVAADPDLLAPAPGVPVVIANDGNLAALAEARRGAGRGRSTVVHVAAGAGVSGGVVIDQEVLHGRTGTAGELGHLTIDPRGPVCTCGNRGCLQVYAGSRAVLDMLAASHGPLTPDEVLALAEQGDAACRRVLSDVGHHLGTAMASVCAVLDPDVVVVGGALSRAGDLLLVPLRDVLAERTSVTSGAVVDVVAGELGVSASAHGALLLARDAAPAG